MRWPCGLHKTIRPPCDLGKWGRRSIAANTPQALCDHDIIVRTFTRVWQLHKHIILWIKAAWFMLDIAWPLGLSIYVWIHYIIYKTIFTVEVAVTAVLPNFFRDSVKSQYYIWYWFYSFIYLLHPNIRHKMDTTLSYFLVNMSWNPAIYVCFAY